MAQATDRFKAMVNNEIQRMALQIIEGLDSQHDNFVARVLADLRELKGHPERIRDLSVSDTDYELAPPRPEIVRNGNDRRAARALEEVVNGVDA